MHRQLRHENIVEFLGVWQEASRMAPSMVLQRAKHGSVLNYLQLHPGRDQFLKLVRTLIQMCMGQIINDGFLGGWNYRWTLLLALPETPTHPWGFA